MSTLIEIRRGVVNVDIRLAVTFPNHHKTKRLKRALGSDGIVSLVFLWLWVAENRPHGELRGMDETDIAVAAQWEGEPGIFISALCELKFLDRKRSLYLVHDWQANNPWASDAQARSDKARKAAKAKWEKRNGNIPCSEHGFSNAKSMLLHDLSNAPSPSPSPSPSPKEEEKVPLTEKLIREMAQEKRPFIRQKFEMTDNEIDVQVEEMVVKARARSPGPDVWLYISRFLTNRKDDLNAKRNRNSAAQPGTKASSLRPGDFSDDLTQEFLAHGSG